jgi:predicted MPP superfamily phosphohydrolase
MTFKPLIAFPIVTLVAVGIHVYLWARLVRNTTQSRRHRRIGAIVIGVLGLAGVVGFMVTRTVGVDVRWLAWIGYTWIAVLFYLLLTLIVLEIPRAIATLWLRRTRQPQTEPAPAPAQAQAQAEAEAEAEPELANAAVARHGAADSSTRGRHGRPIARTTVTEAQPAKAKENPGPPNPDRRLFLARACAFAAGGVAALAVGSGVGTAFGDLRTIRVRTPLAGLDPRLSGFRIAVVSDMHLGPFLRKGTAERVVSLVNRENVDLVAVLGDLADGSVEEVGSATEPLRRLASRHGTYFVTGNHEYSSKVEPWVDQVRELGMRTLLNERVEIASNGTAFDLAGVNDLIATSYQKEGPDFEAALGDRDTSRPVLLLAHQPVNVHEAMKYNVDLQLSGHTHGGQTAPVDRVMGLQQPLNAGLAKMGPTSLFVTRGVGFFGPPVRFGIPPEVAIVELQAAAR